MSVRILLADDQEFLRMGFRMVLQAQDGLEVVGEARDGAEAVALTRELRPDVVLMDVRMPNMDGVEATRELVDGGSGSRVIMLTTFDLDEYAHAALRAGASGFLLKDAPTADLLSAIRAVASGDAVVAPSTTRRLLATIAHQLPVAETGADPPGLSALTPREREVLIAVARGLSNAEIAEALVLSDATVKTHVGHVLAKLELRDRVQIVIYAYDHGLVAPEADRRASAAQGALMSNIRIVHEYPHSPAKVWRALTDSDVIPLWTSSGLGGRPEGFSPVVGTRFRFVAKPRPGWRGIVECEVLEARGPSLLRYSWAGDQNGAVSEVTYRLEPDHGGTRFTFEHTGFRGLGGFVLAKFVLGPVRKKMLGVGLPAALDAIDGDGTLRDPSASAAHRS